MGLWNSAPNIFPNFRSHLICSVRSCLERRVPRCCLLWPLWACRLSACRALSYSTRSSQNWRKYIGHRCCAFGGMSWGPGFLRGWVRLSSCSSFNGSDLMFCFAWPSTLLLVWRLACTCWGRWERWMVIWIVDCSEARDAGLNRTIRCCGHVGARHWTLLWLRRWSLVIWSTCRLV